LLLSSAAAWIATSLGLSMRGLKAYVGLCGEVVEEPHSLVHFAVKRCGVILLVWSPVTCAPTCLSVRLSRSSSEFRQRPVQRKIADQGMHLASHIVLLVQVRRIVSEPQDALLVTVPNL